LGLSSSQHAQQSLRVIDRPALFVGTLACMPQLFDTLFNSFGCNFDSLMEFLNTGLEQSFSVLFLPGELQAHCFLLCFSASWRISALLKKGEKTAFAAEP
jgi:hypothetical protein